MRALADAHYIRYPFPKSLSLGKGLTIGLKASKSSCFALRNLSNNHIKNQIYYVGNWNKGTWKADSN